jgi:hypothetical protein
MSDVVPIIGRYTEMTANIIGAALHSVLLGKVGRVCCAYRQSAKDFQCQLGVFIDFFFHLLCFAYNSSKNPQRQ